MLLLELRNTLPDTDYGYWITDQGQFIPVGTHKHSEVAIKHFQPEGGFRMTPEQAMDIAEEKGWMRVIFRPHTPNVLKAQPSDATTPTGYRALSSLIKIFGKEVEEFDLHLRGTQEFYRGTDIRKALQWIEIIS